MDNDDDELYEPEDSSPQDISNDNVHPTSAKMEGLEEGEESGDDEEIEEDDSESVRKEFYVLLWCTG
jgi:hypothetical protein